MNNIVKKQEITDFRDTDDRVISLYEICKLMSKRHNDAKKLAREIQEKDGFGSYEIIVATINRGNGGATQEIETYSYTKKQAIMIGARLDSSNIIILVNKLEELTRKFQMPTTYLDAIKQLVVTEEARVALEIDNKAKELKIIEDAPKVEFATNISKAINSINIGSYAKALSEEYGVKIGQNKLFAFLRENDVLIKSGRRKNDPMSKYINNNYFILSESNVITSYGLRAVKTTLITGKGQLGLSTMILNHFKN
jgi:phage antirepressor YoqD-like protein